MLLVLKTRFFKCFIYLKNNLLLVFVSQKTFKKFLNEFKHNSLYLT